MNVRPISILVVDDNLDSARSMEMLLALDGHTVAVATDGNEAVARVLELKPDALMLDIGLPGMNGYEVARAVRSSAGLEHVRLFAMTGYGTHDDKVRAAEAGFDAHFAKPVDYDALQALLRRLFPAA